MRTDSKIPLFAENTYKEVFWLVRSNITVVTPGILLYPTIVALNTEPSIPNSSKYPTLYRYPPSEGYSELMFCMSISFTVIIDAKEELRFKVKIYKISSRTNGY